MKDDDAPLPLRPRTRPTTMEWFNEGLALEVAPTTETETEHHDDQPPRSRRWIGGTIAAVLLLTGAGLLFRSRQAAAPAPLPQPAMAPVAAPVVPAAPLNRSL